MQKKLANRYDDYFDQLISQEIRKTMKMPDPRKTIGFTVKTDKDGNKDFNFPVEDIVLLRNQGFTTEEINSII
jgi:hypothetical protein